MDSPFLPALHSCLQAHWPNTALLGPGDQEGEACSWLSAHHGSQNFLLVWEAMQTRFGGLGLNSESIHMEYRGPPTNGDKNCLRCSTSSQPEFSFPSWDVRRTVIYGCKCSWLCPHYFTCVFSLNLPMRLWRRNLLSLFFRWGKWVLECLSMLLKVIELVRDRDEIWTHPALSLQTDCFITSNYQGNAVL